MLRLWLIRHGQTEGNRASRYIGVTDEPLCPKGREMLKRLDYPRPQALYVSPMRRCVETAGILFPGQSVHIVDELAECNFGDFENKNYKELDKNTDYQAWVDSNGMLPFPNGESREQFKRRGVAGFEKAVAGCIRRGISRGALVIHGGTIMNIMEEFAGGQKQFYEWHVKCGEGYEVELDTALWQKGRRSLKVCTTLCRR